ncbi:MAG: hypothetical protein V3U58_06755, partial [Thermodesulfobacteriota bacterium]
MLIVEKEIKIPSEDGHKGLLDYFRKKVLESLSSDEIPIRFVITQTDNDGYSCELGVLSDGENLTSPTRPTESGWAKSFWQEESIFDFNKRKFED